MHSLQENFLPKVRLKTPVSLPRCEHFWVSQMGQQCVGLGNRVYYLRACQRSRTPARFEVPKRHDGVLLAVMSPSELSLDPKGGQNFGTKKTAKVGIIMRTALVCSLLVQANCLFCPYPSRTHDTSGSGFILCNVNWSDCSLIVSSSPSPLLNDLYIRFTEPPANFCPAEYRGDFPTMACFSRVIRWHMSRR